MCIIVDACMAQDVFAAAPSDDGKPIVRWLLKGKGLLIYGGQLKNELVQMSAAARTLVELRRSGRAFDAEADEPARFAAELALCEANCKSNDAHVVALGRVSGARTLATRDSAAMEDFRNKTLIAKPRGKIYQRPEHAALLVHTVACKNRGV